MYTLPMASVAQYQLVTGQGAVLMQVPAGSVCLVRLSVILFRSLTHVGVVVKKKVSLWVPYILGAAVL